MMEMDLENKELIEVRKLFFVLPIDALSELQVFVITTFGEKDCQQESIV